MKTPAAGPFAAPLPCVLAAVAAILVACGCGSSDPVSAKSAPEILAAAQAAAKSASAVHIEADLRQGRLQSTLDAHVSSAKGGSASFSLGPIRAEMLRIGQSVYLKADAAVESELGIEHVPANTWIKLPSTVNDAAGLVSLADQDAVTERYLATNDRLTKGRTTTVEGQPAIELKETGHRLYTATIYVANSGTPYPLKITKQGRESGTITFSGWNQPVRLAAPVNAPTAG